MVCLVTRVYGVMMSLELLINKVREEISDRDERLRRSGETYAEMYKALATIKINLDRGLRQGKLVEAAMDAVDLARSLTPYFDYSNACNKIDPAYTVEERERIVAQINS